MLATNKSEKQKNGSVNLPEAIGEDDVRRAFGKGQGMPAIKPLRSGMIKPSVTYELVCGRVPHTQEDFYAVNVLSLRPGSALRDWLMSGVFWTRQEADSYIRQLKSGKARI